MGRARCLSDVACGLTAICGCVRRSWIPGAPRRRSRSQRCIFVLDQGRLWASGTVRQLPDEDAIPPDPALAGRKPCYLSDRTRGPPFTAARCPSPPLSGGKKNNLGQTFKWYDGIFKLCTNSGTAARGRGLNSKGME